MRTTLDLPDPLFREAKATAARRGISLKELFTAALQKELKHEEKSSVNHVDFPLVRGKRRKKINFTRQQIEEALLGRLD